MTNEHDLLLRRVRRGATRVCKACGDEQPIGDFPSYVDSCGNTQHKFTCNTCIESKKSPKKAGKILHAKPMCNPPIMIRRKPRECEMKRCRACSKKKRITAFYEYERGGYTDTCKKCMKSPIRP